jgi:probable F420-dependent oxidoreductase
MRISFAEAMCDPAQYIPLARACDEVGFDAFVIPDSIAYPEVSDSKYPYTQDGNREFLNDRPFIDPFVLAATMGAVTTRLRFHTFVIKLAIRHPVLVAKQAMSLAAITNNRFSLGVGISPWPEDFAITGVPWKGRGERMNEMMEILHGLMKGDFYSYEGKVFQFQSIKLTPAPSQPVPLLVGGHSEPALERAAKYDGWMHAGGDLEEMKKMIAKLKEIRKRLGKEHEPFQIHAASGLGINLDGLKQLEAMGVTDAIIGFRIPYHKDTMPLQAKIDLIRMYGDMVIKKLRS